MATNILSNCHFDLAKIKKLYLGVRNSTGGTINFPLDYDVTYGSNNSIIQYWNWTATNIITIGSQDIQLYDVLWVGENITFDEVLIIDRRGRNYIKTLSFEISGLDQTLIDNLEIDGLITDSRLEPIPTVAILVDENEQLIIVGYDFPLKIDSISNGINRSDNNISVVYKTTSISRSRTIDFPVTPSITPTISVTPSITPSVSLSSSVSPTPSASRTPSRTPSNTPSITPSNSLSPSQTPSISITSTPSVSLSNTPSISPTPSITPSTSPGPTYFGFTTEWVVSGDATARTITLPFTNNGAYNATVDWGDTSFSTITAYNDADRVHTYSSNGTYTVQISGSTPGWSFGTVTTSKDKITKVKYWGNPAVFSGFSYLTDGFYQCTNLTSIGSGKILANSNLTSLSQLFLFASITSLPSGFLDNCVNVTNMQFTFAYNDFSSIPVDFFRYMTGVTIFHGVFEGCTNVNNAGVPVDLFRYNTEATSMKGVFRAFSIIYEPPDAFLYNTKVTDFGYVFMGCSSLTGITDSMYFRHSTGSTITHNNTFFQCTNLESIPNGLFDNGSTTFNFTFSACPKLQVNPYTFITNSGDTTTRFLNISPDFRNTFDRATFTGVQGTAPDLWNYTYGTGTPLITDCFNGAGNSLTSLSNYGSIPVGWL